MTVTSDDGFWEMQNGQWTPTEKQKTVIAQNTGNYPLPPVPKVLDTSQHTKFVPETTMITNSEISTNRTGNEGYIQLGSLTTTTTHTAAAKAYMGNPFYQGFSSRRE